jgi:hypothetical protein
MGVNLSIMWLFYTTSLDHFANFKKKRHLKDHNCVTIIQCHSDQFPGQSLLFFFKNFADECRPSQFI